MSTELSRFTAAAVKLELCDVELQNVRKIYVYVCGGKGSVELVETHKRDKRRRVLAMTTRTCASAC